MARAATAWVGHWQGLAWMVASDASQQAQTRICRGVGVGWGGGRCVATSGFQLVLCVAKIEAGAT